MVSKKYPLIAREGAIHIAIAVSATIIATILLGWGSLPFWLVLVFVLQFFRDPPRKISDKPGAVVSPASGKVVSISEEDCPYFEGVTFKKISVFMNVFSVHSNLIPHAGVIQQQWYHPGKFFNAALAKASTENERNAIWIKTSEGEDIVSVQIAGLIARRILSYVEPGDAVDTGDRYGFIRFGSRVDVFLPLDAKIIVNVGDWVSSGNHQLAQLPR
jgi:phosphatidylserine decarboxylase